MRLRALRGAITVEENSSEAILEGTTRPAEGRVLVTHLGVGLADVVFADAIVRRAEAAGGGVLLSR